MDYWERQVEEGLVDLADYWAPELQKYAARNRPWRDRTHHAKQGLQGLVERGSGGIVTIVLKHGVFYGTFLETGFVRGRHKRSFAILWPTLRRFEARIWSSARSVFRIARGKVSRRNF